MFNAAVPSFNAVRRSEARNCGLCRDTEEISARTIVMEKAPLFPDGVRDVAEAFGWPDRSPEHRGEDPLAVAVATGSRFTASMKLHEKQVDAQLTVADSMCSASADRWRSETVCEQRASHLHSRPASAITNRSGTRADLLGEFA